MRGNSLKANVFVLGNHYFHDLADLYEVRHATQADIVEKIGPLADIGEYFACVDFQPDILFITDESLPPMYSGLEKLQFPVVGYLIDSHLHLDWHRHFANVFDHCFIAQQNYFHDISQNCSRCTLLPLFASGDLSENRSRDIDVCFVGTLDAAKNPQRVRFIDAFKQCHPLTVAQGAYKELFNRSRIILNQSVWDDLNFRVFEAMACGGLLLTDSVGNGLEDMFSDGIHLVLYEKGNVSDAVNKATFYLANERTRQHIALAGHLKTVNGHTAIVRMLTVHKVFQNLLAGRKVDKTARIAVLKRTYSILALRYKGSLGGKTLNESYRLLVENLDRQNENS